MGALVAPRAVLVAMAGWVVLAVLVEGSVALVATVGLVAPPGVSAVTVV